MNTGKIHFKPKAHILVLLGEELIKSPVMAIYELVKNGYDADATEISVNFENIEHFEKSKITVQDNGTGITKEVLENVWFEPGTDYRKPVDSSGVRQIQRSPIFNRIPMGEKGVGRFAVHKLGNEIKLTSRPSEIIINEKTKKTEVRLLDYEISVAINWKVFSQTKYLQDVQIEWSINKEESTFLFQHTHGTQIEISSLKESWNRGMARQLKRNTLSMLSPKNNSDQFKINLEFNNWWLNDFPDVNEILENAPYKLSVLLDKKFNMTFEYAFDLAYNKEIGNRKIDNKSKTPLDKKKHERYVKGDLKPYYRKFLEEREYDANLVEEKLENFQSEDNELPYGDLMIEIYSFDLDSESLKDYSTNPSAVKSLLKEHAGIKVFKGDLRVFDYGDPGNDWLGLDIKRVNNKTWFSNNQNIGYIYLDDEYSGALIEKTNREGFINNFAFDHLLMTIDFILTEFKAERLSDREKWLLYNKKGTTNSFQNQIKDFKTLINNSDLDKEEQKVKLLNEAVKLEEKYENDKNNLLIPAGVGMTASFAIHEIEKLVPRLEESVRDNPINRLQITDQVTELRDYVEGVLSVMKKGGNKPISIIDSINQAFNNYSGRIKSRDIGVNIICEDESLTVNCDKRLFITMLMNLIDNSIYWLDTIHKNGKSIYVSVSKNDKNTTILFVDNGPGFKDTIEDIVRPFFSRKDGGIGIGMYLIDTVMIQYGKLNILLEEDELLKREIPSMYDGAAVELVFSKMV